jgi:hypothetical protein
VRLDLVALKEFDMVKSFEVISHKRGANELCWLLRIRGATAIGANYDSSYLRKPGPLKRAVKAQKLELIDQVIKVEGWEWMPPQNYNSANRKPEKTPQYDLLLEAYGQALLKDIEEKQNFKPRPLGLNEEIQSYNATMYRSLVPKGANDWLAYLDLVNLQDQTTYHVVVVLILCANLATSRFWQQRIKMYGKIAPKIAIIGVFNDLEEAGASTKQLTKAGMQASLLSNVSEELKAIEEKYLT